MTKTQLIKQLKQIKGNPKIAFPENGLLKIANQVFMNTESRSVDKDQTDSELVSWGQGRRHVLVLL